MSLRSRTSTPRSAVSRTPKGRRSGANAAGLALEIGKRRPFDLPEQEAYLNLHRTAAFFASDFHQLFKHHGLTESSYNALRILRGCKSDPQAPRGRTCSQVGEHLIAHVPDVTRLVDRLEELGLATRCRCERDRRVVYIAITPKGDQILAKLDQPVLDLHKAQLGHLSGTELAQLSRLLTKARGPAARPRGNVAGSRES